MARIWSAGVEEMRQWLAALFVAMQWRRGGRAGLTIGVAMWACLLLHRSPTAAALGAFNVLIVDNGGPYRTRLRTMSLALSGGAFAFVVGAILPLSLPVVLVVTAAVCFCGTFARVISQPLASTSVLLLISYFAGLGGMQHTFYRSLLGTELVLLGGLWAMFLSLVFWPLDPFRPARLAVSTCFGSLAELTTQFALHCHDEDIAQATRIAHEGRRKHRIRVEDARAALAATTARAPSRTSRERHAPALA